MKIGVDVKGFHSPLEDMENIICAYGEDREIGYLKINPERVPVIIAENKAKREINRAQRVKRHNIINRGFELIADYRGVVEPAENGGPLVIFGNAYIVKRQLASNTGLTMAEIVEVLEYLENKEYNSGLEKDRCVACYAFDYDKEKRCYL